MQFINEVPWFDDMKHLFETILLFIQLSFMKSFKIVLFAFTNAIALVLHYMNPLSYCGRLFILVLLRSKYSSILSFYCFIRTQALQENALWPRHFLWLFPFLLYFNSCHFLFFFFFFKRSRIHTCWLFTPIESTTWILFLKHRMN